MQKPTPHPVFRLDFVIRSLLILSFCASAAFAQTMRSDILIDDFEKDHYGPWKVEGDAFGPGPAAGTLPGQGGVSDFRGKRLVNTYFKGDRSQGTLTSPEFKIERKYINFLIGGGGFKNETCMKLYVDGAEVRQATGPNTAPGGSEKLNWSYWDVSEFEGKQAVIRILDRRSGFWGHINVDHIFQSDAKKDPIVPSFKSKVPMYEYPTGLAEQLEAVKTNPLLNRFHESRKKLATDRYRPKYHYVNPEGNLNDPNGLTFWKGNWHLFYQAYPPEDPRQHWGHAYSEDLVRWKDLPLAIYPDPEDKCFSGSALAEDDRVVAIYYGVGLGNMVAVSDDPLLLNWEKLSGRAVIPYHQPDGKPWPFRIYDPCIWKEGEYYYSLSGVTRNDGPGGKRLPGWYLFRSRNLTDWEYMHQFVENDRYSLVDDDGACPYFWPIGDQSDPEKRRHILLYFSHRSGGKYLVGKYDTENQKFHVTGGGDFNHGPYGPAGIHAPSACPDGKGNVIAIFNTNEGYPVHGWAGMMTLPWKLSLLPGDRLGIKPVESLRSLRDEHRQVKDRTIPANKESVLEGISGNTTEILAEIDPRGADSVQLNVLRSADKEEYTQITFYPNRGIGPGNARPGRVVIDSTFSSLQGGRARAPEAGDVSLEKGEPIRLHIFLDKSIIEVFVNGRQYVGQRVYPTREDSVGVSIGARGGEATLKSLDAWQLKSIYE